MKEIDEYRNRIRQAALRDETKAQMEATEPVVKRVESILNRYKQPVK